MEERTPDRTLKALVVWSAITFTVFWLPAVRGLFDGATYSWSSFGFSGRGIAGDYWFPVLASSGALAFLYLGWRRPGGLFQTVLVLWHLMLAAGAVQLAINAPDSFRFRGDTLGIDVSLAWTGPILFGAFALTAIVWTVRNGGSTVRTREWNARNGRLLGLAAVLLPFQFLLLRFGEPHGASDQIGVLLTLAQWGLITAALYPMKAANVVR